MKKYHVQVTDAALMDLNELYEYIAIKLLAPENALDLYNRIAGGKHVIVTDVLYSASDIEKRLRGEK